VDLDVVDTVGCGPGEWRASANQLILRLQASCATIEGGFFPAASRFVVNMMFLRIDNTSHT
jgi:hypothetical protein